MWPGGVNLIINLLDEIRRFADHNLDTAPRGSKYHTEEVPDRPEYRFSRVVEIGEGEIGFDEAFWIIREERVDRGVTSTPIEERHVTSALHELLLQTEECTDPFPIHSWQADVEDTKQTVCHVFHLCRRPSRRPEGSRDWGNSNS